MPFVLAFLLLFQRQWIDVNPFALTSMLSSIKRAPVVQSSHSLARANMKRYHTDEPFDSDDDFEQAMARG